MYEWSEEDLMVRDAVRGFIDKEIRPHIDELETGVLPPYDIIRNLLKTFGVDAMASDALEKEFARDEAVARGEAEPKTGSGGGPGMTSMGAILNIELSGVSLGIVASMGVSLGLTPSTIRSKGTLAQKKRWLPELVTLEKVGAWAITEPDSGSDALGGMKTTVRRDGDGYILNGQKTFITNATNGKSRFLSLAYQDPKIHIVGPAAIVRFTWVSEGETIPEGKKTANKLHILMNWQKQGADWKLLSRASTKL